MTQISKEYAEALFSLACETGCENEIRAALETMDMAVKENGELMALLSSPAIPIGERTDAIDAIFGASAHEYAVSFLKLLCEKGRIAMLTDAVSGYCALCDARGRVIKAKVTSALPLTKEELSALKESLAKKSGGEIELECVVDKSVMGGLIVEFDGRIADGSLRRKLNEVKEEIV